MKLHLPLPLRSALLAACATIASSYSEVQAWDQFPAGSTYNFSDQNNQGTSGLDLGAVTAGKGGVFFSDSQFKESLLVLNNGTYNFTNNTAQTEVYDFFADSVSSGGYGGALYIGIYYVEVDRDTTLHNTIINSTVNFEDNKAITWSGNENRPAQGGAIDGGGIIVNNSTLNFTRNAAISRSAQQKAYGGAITLSSGGAFCGGYDDQGWPDPNAFTNDSFLTFTENYAESENAAYGGAIYGRTVAGDEVYEKCKTCLSFKGISFTGNYTKGSTIGAGGAVSLALDTHSRFVFYNCDSIVIKGNYAQAPSLEDAKGGALYASQNSCGFAFEENDSVEIRGNYITDGKDYILNAFTIELPADELSYGLEIKTKKGQTFTCYDGGVIEKGILYINGDAESISGITDRYQGTVTFCGRYAESDLKKLYKGVTPSEENIQESRTIRATAVTVADGTLVLDKMNLEAHKLGFSVYMNPLVQVGGQAKLVMKDSVIRASQTMGSGLSIYANMVLTNCDFTGANEIYAMQVAAGGTWVFNVTAINLATPLVKLSFYPDPEAKDSQYLLTGSNTVFDIEFDKTKLGKGKYKLLEIDAVDGNWKGTGGTLPTIAGMAKSTSIGSAGQGDVYLEVDDDIYALIYDKATEAEKPLHRANTTLTWSGGSGTWKDEAGGGDGAIWTVPEGVNDKNFYTGDAVEFKSAAGVTIEGTVRPGSVLVENGAGQDVTFSGSGQITDVDIPSKKVTLTKKGGGKLTINTENAYTGGTVLEAGELVAGEANAFGLGAVTVSGGTLNMGDNALANDVVVSNDSAINNAGSFAGKLTVEGGTLSGDDINLAKGKSAELKGGTVQNVLTGAGGVTVSGDVTLSGANTYSGGTTVQSGTLTVGGSGQLGSGVVTLSGGSLDMGSNALTNEVVVSKDATVNNAGSFAGKLTVEDGTLSGDAINLAKGKLAELKGGTVQNVLTGAGGVTVSGNVTLSGANTYTGTTTVEKGTLTVNGSIAGEEIDVKEGATYKGAMSGKTLTLEGTVVGDVDGGSATVTGTLNGNFTDGTLTLNGGKVQGSVTLGTSGQMTVNGANSTVGGTITLNSGGELTLEAGSGLTAGALTLSGGTLDLSDALGALTVTTFTSTAESVLDVGDLANMEVGNHTIFSYTTASGADESHLKLQGLDSVWSRKTFTLQKQAKALVLNVSGEVADLTWTESTSTWSAKKESGGEWTVTKEDMDKHFFNGDNVTFENAGDVPIDGEVNPGSITVKGNSDTTFKSADGKTGALTGTGKLTKEGEGKLTIETDNSKYSGDVEVKGGTLTVGEAASLGSGTVTLSGGSLDMSGNELANDVVVSQDAKLDNAGSFAGNLTVEGGRLEGDVNLAEGKSAELKGGTVEGNLTGDGSVTVSGDVTLSGTNNYTGGTTVKSGELTVDGSLSSDVELQGGSLNVGEKASVTGDVTVQKGASVTVESGGTLDGNLTLEKGASLSSDDGLTVKEEQTFTLSGGTLTSDVTLEDGGTLAVEGSDQSIQGDLTLSGGTVEMGSHNPLAVKGDLTIDGETDVMLDSSIDLSAAEGQELFTYTGTLTGDVNDLDLSETLGDARGKVTNDEAKKVVALELYHATLTWDNGSTATWTNDRDHQWDSEESDKSFHQLDNVVFDGAGDVPIEGEVKPGAIEVKGDDDTIFQNAEGKTGSIAGKAKLTKEGKGTLTINTDNKNYAGEIEVKGGTLKAGHKNAFGSGSVSITNATFDGGDFAVKNPVVLSGASSIKGASSAQKITFADGAQISGLDGYKLSTGNSLTIGSGGSSYSGSITFDGGQLSLTGGVFDLTGADIDFTGETSVLDLRDWAGLDYGHEYKLMDTQGLSKKTRAVAEEDDEQDVWEERFTTVLSNKSLERLSHLEERDGDVYLVIERPSENPTVTAALKPNHRHAYQTLAKIAHLGTATGSLATLAEEITATDDPDVARAMLTRLSGEELATAITAQTEGNLAHLRRLRGAVGSGQAITASGKVGAYITSYSELSTMDQDAQGSGFHRTEIGGSFGLEASIVDKSVVGVALSAGRAYVSPSAPAGRYHEDTTREDLYVVADFGVVRSTTTVGLGEHEFDIRRTLPNGMVSAAQDMKGNSVNFSEELAISLSSDESGSFETFFSMESSYNRIDSFVEKGADTASISVDSHDSWATDFSLGLRANFLFSAFSGAPSAVFSMQAAVVASVGDTVTDVTMRYVGAPDLPYTTRSAKRNRWGYNLGAALTLPVTANAALFGSAEAILRGDSREATATVGLKLNF